MPQKSIPLLEGFSDDETRDGLQFLMSAAYEVMECGASSLVHIRDREGHRAAVWAVHTYDESGEYEGYAVIAELLTTHHAVAQYEGFESVSVTRDRGCSCPKQELPCRIPVTDQEKERAMQIVDALVVFATEIERRSTTPSNMCITAARRGGKPSLLFGIVSDPLSGGHGALMRRYHRDHSDNEEVFFVPLAEILCASDVQDLYSDVEHVAVQEVETVQ